MALIDLLLNLAGLLLWFNWRSAHLDRLAISTPVTLAGTLRRAEPSRFKRWHFLATLAALLIARAWLYRQLGPLVDWTPSLRLGPIAVWFRSDYFSRSLAFSVLSFVSALGLFYLSLLLVSVVNAKSAEQEPLQRIVRLQLGRADSWPWFLKIILPLVSMIVFWLCIEPLLVRWEIVPAAASFRHRFEQAGTLALGVYCFWKYLIVTVLALYLLSSYVYLGNHPLWSFVAITGKNLLTPLRFIPLRIGKIDLAPFMVVALVLTLAEFAQRKLIMLYAKLPL